MIDGVYDEYDWEAYLDQQDREYGSKLMKDFRDERISESYQDSFEEGVKAYQEGVSHFDNPYFDKEDYLIKAWADGWASEQVKKVESRP